MARPKNPGKKDLHRTIIAIPKEMHEALRRIAEKKTNETNGVIIYTISMVGREAFEEKIEKELGKGARTTSARNWSEKENPRPPCGRGNLPGKRLKAHLAAGPLAWYDVADRIATFWVAFFLFLCAVPSSERQVIVVDIHRLSVVSERINLGFRVTEEHQLLDIHLKLGPLSPSSVSHDCWRISPSIATSSPSSRVRQ